MIKSIQRGVSASSGSTTITAVNVSKAFVISSSKGSAGYAGTNSVATTEIAVKRSTTFYNSGGEESFSTSPATTTMSGGSTNLTTKLYSAKLNSSTSVGFDGPVEWQVIEYL